MNRKWNLYVAAAGLVLLAISASSCKKLFARDNLNKGVAAYKAGQYQLAVDHFKKSIEYDSTFTTARMYLATAYIRQFEQGNAEMAQAAEDQYLEVLRQHPGDALAIESIASLYYSRAERAATSEEKLKILSEARRWYAKLTEVQPRKEQAWYSLGVIAYLNSYADRMKLRAELGMKPEDPGPLKDKKKREELRAKNGALVEEGLRNLHKALEIKENYDDAMAYINLLYRERADLGESKADYDRDTEEANRWLQRTLDARGKALPTK